MRTLFPSLYIPLFFLLPLSLPAEPPSAPEFSHSSGTFDEPFSLELASEEGTTIYYSTDNRLPDPSSNEYRDPVEISGTVMISARAYDGEGNAGDVATKIYSQLDESVIDFNSNLPLVIVHQIDEAMRDYCHNFEERWGIWCDGRATIGVTVIDLDEDGRSRLFTDNPHLYSLSESNYRGASSLGADKKQFGVRFVDEHGENRNEPVLGMPPDNNWIMSAPWDDKTLIRNAVAFQLSRDIGRYSPRTRFVELFMHYGSGPINEHHYHGVYQLTERIKWDDNRVDIAKITLSDNTEPEITGGYILNYDLGNHIQSSYRGTQFELVRPQRFDITNRQRNWLSNFLGDLERSLFGDNFRNPDTGYAAYLDADSFIDHHLITEALKEIDGFRKSTYLYKDRNGPLFMGPLWDYNFSLGNGDFKRAFDPHGWYHDEINQQQYLNGWYTRLFQDPDFEQRYRKRWWELRQGPLSNDHIINKIRDYAEKLDEAQQRNFERWPILGQYVWHNKYWFETYEEEIDYMINWVNERLEWVDQNIGPAPDGLSETGLRYYWYFGDQLPNNTPFETLDAGYSLLEQGRIRFQSALEGYPFDEEHPDWRRASMERRNRPTELNYQPAGNEGRPYDPESGRALQVRQPFSGDGGDNTLIFELPATGIRDVIFRFVAMDEGAAEALLIDYSVQEEEPEWVTTGLPDHEYPLRSGYQLYELDFRDIPEVNDNTDFKIRIRFSGEDMLADDGSRVTFNNFSLEAASHDITENNDAEDDHVYDFRLLQNYPNPFNPVTNIIYNLPEPVHVTLKIYDVTGREVATLVDRRQEAGEYSQVFDGTGLASGIYLYELRAGGWNETRTMTFIK